MSENETIAVMAAIIHASCVGRDDGYSVDASLKAAVEIYDKAVSLPPSWHRRLHEDPVTKEAP